MCSEGPCSPNPGLHQGEEKMDVDILEIQDTDTTNSSQCQVTELCEEVGRTSPTFSDMEFLTPIANASPPPDNSLPPSPEKPVYPMELDLPLKELDEGEENEAKGLILVEAVQSASNLTRWSLAAWMQISLQGIRVDEHTSNAKATCTEDDQQPDEMEIPLFLQGKFEGTQLPQLKASVPEIMPEAAVYKRVHELQREGLWSERRLPKAHEPSRIKAHWDYLLEEMQWLATDFQQERKWKRKAAQKCSKMVVKSFQEKTARLERAGKEEELKIRKLASYIGKEVRNFWSNVQKLVEYQEQSKIEELKKKAMNHRLSFIVDQTEKISSMLAKSFRNPLQAIANGEATSSLADLNSDVSTAVSDDEFEPDMDDAFDDEETISKAEDDPGSVKAEVEALKKECDMSLDDLLDELPAGYIQEKIAISNNQSSSLSSKTDSAESKPRVEEDDYIPSESDSDVDDTIDIEEKMEANNPIDYTEELQALDDDNKLTVEEIRAKYMNHKQESLDCDDDETSSVMSGLDESTCGETTDMSEADPSERETEDDESFVTDDRGTPDDNEEQNLGLASLLQTFDPETAGDAEKEEDTELNAVAAMAECIQPKGYTLSSTHVVTKVPVLLKHTLREYQHIGLDWLVTMYEKKLNGILADEMGLGKTIQTIALLAHLACVEGNWGPHLIVVPTSVMLNWEMEFKKWCPGFKILTYYGNPKERKLKRKGWTKPNSFHVCITSYKMVVQDHFSFRRKRWKYLILDEAQNIKNFKSQRWQLLLNFSTQRRLLLTGTPLQNNLMELWSLMHFLMPNVFQSHREFREWFSNPVTGMVEGNTEYNQNIIRRLHKVLRPFMLRRLKSEVEKQLPKKFEHLIMCRLSKRQRHLYEDFMSRSRTKETLSSGNLLRVMNVLMQLRKVCNHPNLFEPRPISSPLQTEGITHIIPSLAWNMLDNVPFETVASDLFRLTDMRFGTWDATEILSLRPTPAISKVRNDARLEYTTAIEPSRQKYPYLPSRIINCDREKPILSRDLFNHYSNRIPPIPRLRRPVPMFMLHVDPANFYADEEFMIALSEVAKRRKLTASTNRRGRIISFNCDTKEVVRMPAKPPAPISKLSAGQILVGITRSGAHQVVMQGSMHSSGNLAPAASGKTPVNLSEVAASPLAYSSAMPNCTLVHNRINSPGLNPGSLPSLGGKGDTVVNVTNKQSTSSLESKDSDTGKESFFEEIVFNAKNSPFDEFSLEVEDSNLDKPSLKRKADEDSSDETEDVIPPPESKRIRQEKSVPNYRDDPTDDDDDDDEDEEDDYLPRGIKQRTVEEKQRALIWANSKASRLEERKRSLDCLKNVTNIPRKKRKFELSSDAWLRTHGVNIQDFDSDIVEIRKLKDRKAVIDRLQNLNIKRCHVNLAYGADTVQACKIFELPSVTFPRKTRRNRRKDWANKFYFDQGLSEIASLVEYRKLSNCTNPVIDMDNEFWRHTDCLDSLVWRMEIIMYALEDILKRFVLYTPSVSAPLIQKRVFKPSVSRGAAEAALETELRHSLHGTDRLLHPIASAMSTQFPDSRLIQYDCGKLQVLDNLLRKLKAGGHRALLFTQMARMLDILEIFLNYHGYVYLRLDGSTKIDQRQLLMEKFNTDRRIFCFILSTRSGGIGVNLTGADTVIFYDSDWNPTMDAQAQDRCHRIGQTRDVNIYRLVSEKTVEENILKKSNQKKLLGELAIEGGKFTTAYFKNHTIRDLFEVNQSEEDARNRMDLHLASRSRRNSVVDDLAPPASDLTSRADGLTPKAIAYVYESALTAAEDDTDVQAARTVCAENAAELAEFDENIPLDNLKETQIDEPSRIAIEMSLILSELNPVERYAIKFMEERVNDWSKETYASAQKEFELQKQMWEEDRVKRLQEEKHKARSDEEDNDSTEEDELNLTYSSAHSHNQIWYTPTSGELMPIWAPPTPPQDESDVYIDVCQKYLYRRNVMPESQLPAPYIPPKKKSVPPPPAVPTKTPTSGAIPATIVLTPPFTMEHSNMSMDSPSPNDISKKFPIKVHRREEPIFAPRSLFDRPSPALAKLRRDYRLQKYNCRPPGSSPTTPKTLGPGSITFPVVPAASTKPTPTPTPPTHPEPDWLIVEDYSVLQSMTNLLELPLSLMVVNLAQTPNWDMASQIVNLGSRCHRSQKQCRLRYENFIEPREEGKLFFDPQVKKKKTKAAFIKLSPPSPQRAASLMKTSQLVTQDNGLQVSKVVLDRFESIKTISAKRNPVPKSMVLNPQMRSNRQSLIFSEHGINFDAPMSATAIAQARYERVIMERRKLLHVQEGARAHALACVNALCANAAGIPVPTSVPIHPQPGMSNAALHHQHLVTGVAKSLGIPLVSPHQLIPQPASPGTPALQQTITSIAQSGMPGPAPHQVMPGMSQVSQLATGTSAALPGVSQQSVLGVQQQGIHIPQQQTISGVSQQGITGVAQQQMIPGVPQQVVQGQQIMPGATQQFTASSGHQIYTLTSTHCIPGQTTQTRIGGVQTVTVASLAGHSLGTGTPIYAGPGLTAHMGIQHHSLLTAVQTAPGNVTPPNGSLISTSALPVTAIAPMLTHPPSVSTASDALGGPKGRLTPTSLISSSSMSSPSPISVSSGAPGPSSQAGNILPIVLSPSTSSAITELIGRGVLTASTVTTTNSSPKRQYTLQHHHSQLQQQLQLLQHHQMQQKQQQIQLAVSAAQGGQPQTSVLNPLQRHQIRQQITSISPTSMLTGVSSVPPITITTSQPHAGFPPILVSGILPSSLPPGMQGVTKFTPAQLETIKQSYIRQHSQVIVTPSTTTVSEPPTGVQQQPSQQVKRFQVYSQSQPSISIPSTGPNVPRVIISTPSTTFSILQPHVSTVATSSMITPTNPSPQRLRILTSAGNTFQMLQSQPSTTSLISSSVSSPVISAPKAAMIPSSAPTITMSPSTTIGVPVSTPTMQRPHIQISMIPTGSTAIAITPASAGSLAATPRQQIQVLKQPGRVVSRSIGELDVAELLKQQGTPQRLPLSSASSPIVSKAKTADTPTTYNHPQSDYVKISMIPSGTLTTLSPSFVSTTISSSPRSQLVVKPYPPPGKIHLPMLTGTSAPRDADIAELSLNQHILTSQSNAPIQPSASAQAKPKPTDMPAQFVIPGLHVLSPEFVQQQQHTPGGSALQGQPISIRLQSSAMTISSPITIGGKKPDPVTPGGGSVQVSLPVTTTPNEVAGNEASILRLSPALALSSPLSTTEPSPPALPPTQPQL